ncbi:hypothetical protein BV97_04014 [Novosphingobium resinovorum]|mgnify:CR=1 FL=1|jgi:hypothetical protein|uniref:Uncharacterized protein n=2 Tax=Alphaproteobacteria TaxID=28211 RepID=A0A031JP72_9SPHN|nr:hypothetical protein BV97_04014 [Novosphingobium resinovorum]PHR90433.1 MAG: hypothetical protein COA80_16280 [Leeuwenhoekiella sp.]
MLNEQTTDPHQTESVPGQSIRFGGSFYEFGQLIPLFGSDFVFPLIIYFAEEFYSNAPSGNAKRNLGLRLFLTWVARQALAAPLSAAGRVHEQLSTRVCPSEVDMTEVAETYGDIIRDLGDLSILDSDDETYRSTHLDAVSATLRRLAPYELWPLMPPIRRMSRGTSHIPALGQLGPGRSKVVFEGADAYARSVEASKVRMAQLRRIAEDGLIEEFEIFETGKKLLARSDISDLATITQAIKSLTAYGFNKSEGELIDEVFPKNDPELRLANLLTYLDHTTNGAVPTARDPDGSYGLDCLIRACGGGSFINSHLNGTKRALLCGQLVVMIDTGLNVQPATDLAAEPFDGEFRRGSVNLLVNQVTKTRPEAKTVFSVVPAEGAEALLNVPGFKLSTKSAITMWQEMSLRMRCRARAQNDNAHRYLWICGKGSGHCGVIQTFAGTVAKSQMNLLRDELADDPILGGIEFTRQNIRPTYLAIRNSKHLDSQVVVSIANHNNAGTTFGSYLSSAEYRQALASLIRNFQNQLEAAILVTDISRVVQLGVDAETIVGRAEEAIQNGLDEILFDASAAKTSAIAATPEVELVPDSLESFLTFEPTHEDLVALILVKKGLEADEERFLVANPDRWKNKWMPGLALVTATAARLEQSKYKVALKRALTSAEQGISSGKLRIFVPW